MGTIEQARVAELERIARAAEEIAVQLKAANFIALGDLTIAGKIMRGDD